MKKVIVCLLLACTALMLIPALARADGGDSTAQAVLTEDGSLTFFCSDTVYKKGDTYVSGKVVDVWSEEEVLNSFEETSHRYDYAESCTRVVFDASFADARPKSLDNRFAGFEKLTEIEGMEYLNTSEAASMRNMFSGCESLETVNVSRFDMSSCESISQMFTGCTNLKTIYCAPEADWSNIGGTQGGDIHIFMDDKSLTGTAAGVTVAFDGRKIGQEMAKSAELGGYFTPDPDSLNSASAFTDGTAGYVIAGVTALISVAACIVTIMNKKKHAHESVTERSMKDAAPEGGTLCNRKTHEAALQRARLDHLSISFSFGKIPYTPSYPLPVR